MARLREFLGHVSIVDALQDAEATDEPVDLSFPIKVGGKPWTLLLTAKTSGQPRQVRAEAALLRRSVSATRGRAYGVFVAPFLSGQSQQILTDEGVGWLDLAGNCRLSFGGIHIQVEKAARDPFTTKRSQNSLFAPKSARVVRQMLMNPGPWKVVDLGAAADVSLGQVSNVRQLLLDKEWAEIDPQGSGLTLRNPSMVLDAWREVAQPPTVLAKCYTSAHSQELQDRIAEAFEAANPSKANIAFAGQSAARRRAPFSRMAGEFFYADEAGMSILRRALRLSVVDRGENVTIYEAQDDGIWSDAISAPNRVRMTGDIQTYLDLWTSGERGQEAAEHFRREAMLDHLRAA